MAERVENVVELKEDNFGCDKWRKLSKRVGVMSTSSLRFPTLHHSCKRWREAERVDKYKLKPEDDFEVSIRKKARPFSFRSPTLHNSGQSCREAGNVEKDMVKMTLRYSPAVPPLSVILPKVVAR